MSYDLTEKKSKAIMEMTNIEIQPALLEDENVLSNYTKVSLSGVTALGTAFEPIMDLINKLAGGTNTGLYKVTIPNGTHLAEFKSGIGNLGTVLNSNNQIAGQAVLNPVVFNPTMLFMAATLAGMDRKLGEIKELQQEIMNMLVQKEKAEIRGNLIFLSDIQDNYKYNWDNDLFKKSNHIKVLDIRQTAEQKILFYRDQISHKLKKKSLIHWETDVKKQINVIQSTFKEYQLALYTYAYSSFLDVMLMGNYASAYLDGIKRKIEKYSQQYNDLHTKCYDQLRAYSGSSVQSALLKGLRDVSKATGEVIANIPVLKEGPVDEALIGAGGKLDDLKSKITKKQLHNFMTLNENCVTPFVDNIELIDQVFNHPLSMIFDKDTIYLGHEEKESNTVPAVESAL